MSSCELTLKQSRFVEEYLVDLNATKATIRAGYSRRVARQQGAENLSKPVIRAAIESAIFERSARSKWNAERVIARISEDLEADIAELFSDDWCLKPPGEWPLSFRRGLVVHAEVREIWQGHGEKRQVTGRRIILKFADRFVLLKLLLEHVVFRA